MKIFKKFWVWLVKLLGWKLNLPEKGSSLERKVRRCVFVVAPHTSMLDFLIGASYLWACCPNGKVLIKKEFFWWPLGVILRKLGCIPVKRGNRYNNIVDTAVTEFKESESLSIAITPEATRKLTNRWHRGFWDIANKAKVPIVMTYIDFSNKEIGILGIFKPTDDFEKDAFEISKCYIPEMAKYPEKYKQLPDPALKKKRKN